MEQMWRLREGRIEKGKDKNRDGVRERETGG